MKEIDLRKIEGEGDFPCPECGNVLSPEDELNKSYQILKVEVWKEQLKALILKCKCGTEIRLVGFIE